MQIYLYSLRLIEILHYLCTRLLLIIGAFGRQSSMRCVAIISRPVFSLFGDGVTLRSGLDEYFNDECGLVNLASIGIVKAVCEVV